MLTLAGGCLGPSLLHRTLRHGHGLALLPLHHQSSVQGQGHTQGNSSILDKDSLFIILFCPLVYSYSNVHYFIIIFTFLTFVTVHTLTIH